jgi:tetratricopeptide (TPR) repeat protein
MKINQRILPSVYFIALLSACASDRPMKEVHLSVTPKTVTSNANVNTNAMYKMGRYYQEQNRYDLAISTYKKVLAADHGFVEALNGLGVVYSRQGKYREAIAEFQAAIQQAPAATHLYSNMGYAYYLQGQYAESVVALKQATLLDPSNQLAINNLGLANVKAGNNSTSAQVFAQTYSGHITDIAQAAIGQSDAQQLTLPKDMGVTHSAITLPSIPVAVAGVSVAESSVQLVQVAPHVYELHHKQTLSDLPKIVTVEMPSNVKIEVSNGNGVTGMASTVGRFLRAQGYPTARLTNQKPFQVNLTQIQYRDGHELEAQALRANLLGAPELVQRDDLHSNVSIRLVLGKDVATKTAYFDRKWHGYKLARGFECMDG